MNTFSRRGFLGGLAAMAASNVLVNAELLGKESEVSSTAGNSQKSFYVPWQPGSLDIHHISTGRGSSALAICPDGTVLLIDAGAIYDPLKYTISPKPNNSRRPGEWLARYIARHIKAAGADSIDYMLVSHFHNDHIGQDTPELPKSSHGNYHLTGIMDVAEQVPIQKLIDRGFPDYSYPPASYPPGPLDMTLLNYREFVRARQAAGHAVEKFKVGSKDQIQLTKRRSGYPDFHIRNLAANGEIWMGPREETRQCFPKLEGMALSDYPTENMCSTAVRLQYGKFSYYTGGDMPSDVGFHGLAWRDIETPVAKASGPVSVAVVNHHGYVDTTSPEFVRTMRPRAFIIQAWDSAHPTIKPLFNMLSTDLYPGERDIFATAVKEENMIATRDLSKLKSLNGHVVVRVPKNAETFNIEILDNSDENDGVTSRFGPYSCA